MAAKNKAKNLLKFEKPSTRWGALWRGGIPTGNGTVGASVFGGAGEETVLINHSNLTWQGHTGVLPDVGEKVKEVRKQIEFGDFKKSNTILANELIAKGYRPVPASPLPLCDFCMKQSFEKPVRDYARALDMESGEVTVTYRDGASKYSRNLFVSRVNGYVVTEVTRVGTKNIDMDFSLDLHDRTNVRTPVSLASLPENPSSRYEGRFMYFAARCDNGTDFGAVARVTIFGGSMNVLQDRIRVKGAEKVLILLKPFVESQRDKEWKAIREELTDVKLTYDKLFKEHAQAHAKLFAATDLDLNATDRESTVDALLREATLNGNVKPALLEKLWAFGRFLLIAAGSDAGHPVKSYGLWCGDYKAPRGYTDAMGVLQTIYAQAAAGNLADFLEPVFSKYETMLDDLKKNAIRLFNCRGIAIPAVTAPSSGLPGMIEPSVIHTNWIAGSIGNLFYDYYLYTQDAKFLKTRALPFMYEVARFYEEFFKVRLDGFVDSAPSYSFDNQPLGLSDEPLGIAKNSVIDFCVARELLTNLICGAESANVYKQETAKWEDLLQRIPPYTIAEDGTVCEYLDPVLIDNHDSRSINQLYGVYPGTESFEKDPDFAKAAYATAKKRLSAGNGRHTSGSLSRLASVFARLGASEDALETLGTIARVFVTENLVTAANDYTGMGIGDDDFWAQYRIDGNLGLTSAMQEMLLTSRNGSIRIFPALPQEWRKGSFEGMLTRVGAEVSVSWDLAKRNNTTVKIKCRKSSVFDVQLPDFVTKVKGLPVGAFDPQTHTVKALEIANGKTVTFTF